MASSSKSKVRQPEKQIIDLAELVYDFDKRLYPRNGRNFISVTSVFSLVHSADFLDRWQKEMIDRMGLKALREYLDTKADQGTVMHNLIEGFLAALRDKREIYFDYKAPLKGYSWYEPRFEKRFGEHMDYESWRKFHNWNAWFAGAEIESVDFLERKLFSDVHEYAGTSDALLSRSGLGKGIHDWKSSKSVTPKHLMQASAYVKAYEEETGEKIDFASVVCLGAGTNSGFTEKIIRADVPSKKNKNLSEIDYWFNQFLAHLVLAKEAAGRALEPSSGLPRYILTPSIA